jgi:hypothetical protein
MAESRKVEIGTTEALFRQVNERIEDLNRGVADVSDGKMHVVCECGDPECAQQVALTIDAYEAIRRDSTQFVVVPGHEILSTEIVVANGDDYLVVRKQGDLPEEIAEVTDPRR